MTDSGLLTNFTDTVQVKFKFLEKKFGFTLVGIDRQARTACVSYQSENVLLQITYNLVDWEIGVTFRHKDEEPLFDKFDLLYAAECQSVDFGVAFSPEMICTWLDKLTVILKTKGHGYLVGDKKAYRNLRKLANRRRNLQKQKLALDSLRDEFDRAWQDKNYHRVVDLLAPYSDLLTHTEKAKLDYAKRHA
ncbi:hypothetical protein STSP2_00742 [Anaerohalosphaera lusitana]|uniref:Uncharacterized protein n=1 Tax=Anaerohalosphaera lusitana TaxID=1936003 RepID=A0A1U9NIN9_9BACT|nr:hypothetical protein [Anaerohalosphaera lusitana]AQT67594.1 hypothetical protein STSP2_00742 [Anaerohalosphaera lusitana]